MFKINKLKFLLLTLVAIVIVPSIVTFAQQSNSSNTCKRTWSVSSNGISHTECPDGLHYPSMNAYNDSNYLRIGDPTPEFTFFWVRPYSDNPSIYQNTFRRGYSKQFEFKDNDDIAETYIYLHNSGNPNCNTPNDNNICGKSTIAKDVKLSVKNLQRSGNKFVSEGIISGNKRIHVLESTIAATNTTPASITDKITITTPIDKVLQLDIDNIITSCNPTSSRVRECKEEDQKSRVLTTQEENALFSTGLNLNSIYSNSSVRQGFFASEGYRIGLNLYFIVKDAPTTPQVCTGITTEARSSLNSPNQTYRIRFTPNERSFHDNIQIQVAGGGQAQFSQVNPLLGQRYTELQLTGLTRNSVVTIRSAGSSDACSTRLTFPSIPPTGDSECRELNIIKDDTQSTNETLVFSIQTSPTNFASQANVTATNGTLNSLGNNRYRLTGLNSATTVNAQVPNQNRCRDSLSFTPTPPPPGGEACEAITINTNTYNYQQNPRPTFQVTSKTPTNFQATFRWTVRNQNNTIIETREGLELLSFRPQRALTGNETIRVEVLNSSNPNCRKEITSSLPPKESICEDLQVIRILNPRFNRTIPNNGQPAIFRIDTGSYRGTITFESNSDPELTTFLSEGQRTNGKITVNADSTVIILNRAPNAIIKVYATEQNQFTEKCFLELRANSNDEGDKLTDIEKTVDKPFATNGDILTYTIKYTISPIFGDPNFREALKGLDTAILKDNVRLIYGIQDTVSNPREAINTRIVPLDLIIPNELGSSGDLFGIEGLVIPNLTQKAGRSYIIRYTARLDADIIQDCLTITRSCGFEFPNTASDNFGNQDTASVLATCPFVISRSFGDVFLEAEFENTIDIATCTNRRSSDGPVFTPKPQRPQELIKSGTGVLSAPTHRICQESIRPNPNLSSELDGYKNPLSNFSSGVCEVALFTSSNWTSVDIENSLRSNVSRFSNVTNLNNTSTLTNLNQSSLSSYDALNPNPQNKIYRKTNGNLTINSDSTLVQNDNLAKTIIVQGHDLIINQNITYGTNTNPLFPSQIAFIVIGGDIVVAPEVTDIQGVIVAIPDANGKGGFIRRSSLSNQLLTIKGSIFGDSGPLFAGTSNPGDLRADRGAVTVIYDGNIIINTPPALQSIVQFNQYQTVR